MTGNKALVLLSGGIDSATTLAIAKSGGYEIYALSFDYSQRHARELKSAQMVASAFGVEQHLVIQFDLREIGGSALTSDMAVPKKRLKDTLSGSGPSSFILPSLTFLPGIPSSSPSLLHGPKFFLQNIFLSARTQSITAGILTAGRNILRHMKQWPTLQQRPPLRKKCNFIFTHPFSG